MKESVIVGTTEWTKEKIKSLLKQDSSALKRAIVLIYNQQTYEERISYRTNSINGRGFNAYDAEFLTSIAKKILNNTPITSSEWAISRNKMLKYAGQLLTLSQRNYAKAA